MAINLRGLEFKLASPIGMPYVLATLPVVNSFSSGAGGTALVTMAIAHGFGTGRSVSIPVGLYKGTWFITVVDQLSYTLDGSVYTVDDGAGGISTPPPAAPSPTFTINNLTPTTAQTVTATITNESVGGTPTSGTIDWGDGNGQIALTGSFVSASLMYASAGTKTVVVRLTNAVGTGTSTRTNYVTVTSAATVHTTVLNTPGDSGTFNFQVGSTSRSVICIGIGGNGDAVGAAGGGGAWNTTAGAFADGCSYTLPDSGHLDIVTFNDGSLFCAADFGRNASGATPGTGGLASNGLGDSGFNGGSGGGAGGAKGGGGGGAGGSTGAGGNGVAGTGSGAGGAAGTGGTNSGAGGDGKLVTGNNGGTYGGGGGGGLTGGGTGGGPAIIISQTY